MLYKILNVNKDGENRVVKVFNYNMYPSTGYKSRRSDFAKYLDEQQKRLNDIETEEEYKSAVDLFESDKKQRKDRIEMNIFTQVLMGLGAAYLAFSGNIQSLPIEVITSFTVVEGLLLTVGAGDIYNLHNDKENLNKLK